MENKEIEELIAEVEREIVKRVALRDERKKRLSEYKNRIIELGYDPNNLSETLAKLSNEADRRRAELIKALQELKDELDKRPA